jgi:hypothetical protein
VSSSNPTLCIHCGLPAGDPPQLNRLKNGQTCPACRDRVLVSIPPALPRQRQVSEEREMLDALAVRDVYEAPDARDSQPGHGF